MWNWWPVQVQCMKQGTPIQCTGTTQSAGIQRDFWMGGHIYTHGWFMSVYGKNHHNCCKVISLQLKSKCIKKKKKESWALKNWCFWTVVLEKTLENPLDCKEIQPVHPVGNHSWIFIGRTDAEAPITWPPDAKNWLIGKDPDTGKDWRQEEKGTTEDEMVGWHHRLDGNNFEQALGVGNGQGSLAYCSP